MGGALSPLFLPLPSFNLILLPSHPAMKTLLRPLIARPRIATAAAGVWKLDPSKRRCLPPFSSARLRAAQITATAGNATSSPVAKSEAGGSDVVVYQKDSPTKSEFVEAQIEKVIYGCRFMTLLAVMGSLVGSFLCFIKGCTYIFQAFAEYSASRGKVIFVLVEAIDVYLLGTVMLVFGMGLYELFVSNLDIAKSSGDERQHVSSLFGLFTLKERPKWLEIKSVNELKTKLGHVIVMLLLIGLFDKSKKAVIHTPLDLLCFSASVLFSSGCLFLLSKLGESK